jgi:LmbE family N-acetylglucosaminyl deacetylase
VHFFLSPHLDDAVLSCGGTIHQLTAAGETVHIRTVMSGDPPNPLPDTPIVRELHSRWNVGPTPMVVRRQEDHDAAALVGAQAEHMEIPDCVYRTSESGKALYPDENSLWQRVHPLDPAIRRLGGFRLPADVSHVYIPLGVGNHVDHMVVREIGIALYRLLQTAGNPADVRFYAEYPYSEDADATQKALASISTEIKLAHHPTVLTYTDIAKKVEAVKAYQSQISTFWEDEFVLEKRIRTALTAQSKQPSEHYYQVQRGN